MLIRAYQSLRVVYGDLSISPLYVYKSTFIEDIHHLETNEEIFFIRILDFNYDSSIEICLYRA
ncbi:hypothetical protein EJD97_018370 [Solanum chilense]|uniref:K+ potassium transporter integral membrane domain-containing protein n=1 Tax=Solanum chilense TaxID=4083 RepID=A0A6N2CLF0_SOLCI|nr:hypothetical protein EJD97_018370 [Solanum chilense]